MYAIKQTTLELYRVLEYLRRGRSLVHVHSEHAVHQVLRLIQVSQDEQVMSVGSCTSDFQERRLYWQDRHISDVIMNGRTSST